MGGSHTIYPGYFSTPHPSILLWFTRLLTQLPPSSCLSRPSTPACSPHLLRPQQGFSAFRSLLNGCSQTENIASLSLVCSVKEVCPYLAHCEHFREEAVEPSDPDSLKPRHGAACESWLQPDSSFPPPWSSAALIHSQGHLAPGFTDPCLLQALREQTKGCQLHLPLSSFSDK